MEDSAILDMYFARSEQAITETDRKYGPYCYSVAYHILENRQDSEESVNDTYYSAWRGIPPRRPRQLGIFLGRITRNLAIDRWRRRSADKRGGGELTLVLDELAGCVAAIIGLRQRRVGQLTGTVYKDAAGNWIEPTEATRDIIALVGYEGTDNYRATLQWRDFVESYTPSFGQPWPENLATLYGCFDETMRDKLLEILEQYHLSALPEEICFGSWDEAYVLELLGTPGVVKADRVVWSQCLNGCLFSNGTFSMDIDAVLPDWDTTVSISVICCPADTFYPLTVSPENGMEQWSCTTADGMPVVMALGDKMALLFCQKPDSYMTAVVRFDPLGSNTARKPTRTVLEALADAMDFTLQPRPLSDPQGVRAYLKQTSQAHYAEEEAQNVLPEYTGFSDYLKGNYTEFTENMVYTCLSLDDGAEALLIGGGDGWFDRIRIQKDGQVTESRWVQIALCGNDELVTQSGTATVEYRAYYRRSALADENPQPLEGLGYDHVSREWVRAGVNRRDDYRPIPEDEAQAIRGRHPMAEVETAPLWTFPLEDGISFGQWLRENHPTPTGAARENLLLEKAKEIRASTLQEPNPELQVPYYCLADLDGDGQRELLTSREGVYIRDVYSVRCDRAYALQFWSNMRLLTDGTLEYIQQSDAEESVAHFRVAGGQWQQTLRLWYWGQDGRYLQDTDLDRYYDTELTKQTYGALVEDKTYASISWKSIDDLP